MLTFHIITIFPESVVPYLGASILGRAISRGFLAVALYNPRDYTQDVHRSVDDKAYGGGPGMVMRALPILKAAARARGRKRRVKTIIFSSRGKTFTNAYADKLRARYTDVILIAGRYEGIDARVKRILRAEEVSIGPYTLSGGELPALAVVDAVARRMPGVLGSAESVEERRVASRDVYTRPEALRYRGKTYRVPRVLLSGNHRTIEVWRRARDTAAAPPALKKKKGN